MSRRVFVSLFIYLFTGVILFSLIIFFTFLPKNYVSLKGFTHVSQMSDAAVYTNERSVRFYSLTKAEDSWDDPFLPPRSDADFLYRIKH
ncbi:hypothetical protein MNB_SM-7-497 [hydrothermal vent metagenome]|uniref:Uncharacterized protein n=1 Tax=hydrothermal vent metagenome TaxID=652676 RepID=A0A1W1BUL1_9ZZZZ